MAMFVADMLDDACRGRQPKCLCCPVEVSQRRAAANNRCLVLRIDANVADRRQIDHQAVFCDGFARNVMAAAPHGGEDFPLAGELHGLHDIRRIGAAGDQGRAFVDSRGPDGAGFVIGGIARQ